MRHNEENNNPYPKFLAMIATSTVVMFILMYLNTYASDHIFFSETRAYMAIYMGATMGFVMLLFMLGMYKNWRVLNTRHGCHATYRSESGIS